MKKYLFFLFAVCSASAFAQFPVSTPNIGNGRLVVCGQNLKNYFVEDLAAERPDYHDVAGLEDKTARIVSAFRYLDADIYALCELECKDAAISYLTAALNNAAGVDVYAYVNDNQSVGNEQIKSGFIYRKDRVAPYGANTAASNQQWYRNTMRIQTFNELASGERFVLSMNHFKAKDSTEDKGNAKRERNASDLVSALKKVTSDPDILIMGDLNCLVTESPLQTIQNAGYVEVLLEYNPSAYTYYYYGNNELIDHIYANSTMDNQLNGAGVFHVNTGTRKSGQYWYSDHDPYLVSMNLGGEIPDVGGGDDDEPAAAVDYICDFRNGFGGFVGYTLAGTATWYTNGTYGAVANAYNRECPSEMWLVSDAFDLSNSESAEISLLHNIYYDNSGAKYVEYQTLWYSTDYVSGTTPETATWHQLVIPKYAVKSWVEAKVDLPEEALQENFHYAFKYTASDAPSANYWEIQTTSLKSTVKSSGVEEVIETPAAPSANKFLRNGKLYIQVGNHIYDSLGRPIQFSLREN